jgi:hypothetical protein
MIRTSSEQIDLLEQLGPVQTVLHGMAPNAVNKRALLFNVKACNS